ncbi:MAG: hypothetical protein QM698_11380 [Micropepsaceae bacterium]
MKRLSRILRFVQGGASEGTVDLPPVIRKITTSAEILEALEQAYAQGGVDPSAGHAAPIIIDLGGDGVTLVDPGSSAISLDLNGDGFKDRLGWAGAGEGILALDRDGDGRVSLLSEISFLGDVEGATTDLQGLAAFDSDGDGALTAADERFGEFLIWHDANQDGVSQIEELRTLSEAGVASIGLAGTPTGQVVDGRPVNVIINTTAVTMTDGRTLTAADTALGSISGLELIRRDLEASAAVGRTAIENLGHTLIANNAVWNQTAQARREQMRETTLGNGTPWQAAPIGREDLLNVQGDEPSSRTRSLDVLASRWGDVTEERLPLAAESVMDGSLSEPLDSESVLQTASSLTSGFDATAAASRLRRGHTRQSSALGKWTPWLDANAPASRRTRTGTADDAVTAAAQAGLVQAIAAFRGGARMHSIRAGAANGQSIDRVDLLVASMGERSALRGYRAV